MIALLEHIQKHLKKFITRRQLSKLDVSRYDDINMTLDEILQEKAKGNIKCLTVDLFTMKKGR